MPKYIIKWDYGYGDNYDEIDANDLQEARKMAYDQWLEDVMTSVSYEVVEGKEATDEMREEYLD
jgi:hypothetical protein